MTTRILCVHLHALGLQAAMLEDTLAPEIPAVEVADDRPSARVLALNEVAQRAGLREGMRYDHVLSLIPEIRAYVQQPARLAQVTDICARVFARFSPIVEYEAGFPGVFWLDGRGLSSLWSSASSWTEALATTLRMRGYAASLVCGFSRFGTMVLARQQREGLRVLRSEAQERELVARVSIGASGCPPAVRDEFETLGLRTIGDLRALPMGALRLRYGAACAQWVQLAREERVSAPRTYVPAEVFEHTEYWDEGIGDTSALVFRLRGVLTALFAQLERVHFEAAALTLELGLEWPKRTGALDASFVLAPGMVEGEPWRIELRAAEASVDVALWTELWRLRFERVVLPVAVRSLRLRAEASAPVCEQKPLSSSESAQDPVALLQALAKVRAEFGDASVGRLEVRDAHLPEARQGWAPLTELVPVSPHRPSVHRRVRALNSSPSAFSSLNMSSEAQLPTGSREWIQRGYGAALRSDGPWLIAGAWWRQEVVRAYYYVHTASGAVVWVYFDRRRGRWFLHGEVG